MNPKAVFLGSIGVVAETSDIQRRAYNQAFSELGIPWEWDRATYRKLLNDPGGKRRLNHLSVRDGYVLSASQVDAIHARKTEIACAEVASGIDLRPGVAELIEEVLAADIPLAFVTSTYRANIDAIAQGANGRLPLPRFSAVLTTEDCQNGKPAPDIYQTALARLNADPAEVIAFEDSAASVAAATAAGIFTVATPGAFTSGQDLKAADLVMENLAGVSLSFVHTQLAESRRRSG